MKTILSIIISLVAVSAGFSEVIRSPFVSGNSAASGPFLVDRSIADSIRYQQVYQASDFFTPGSPVRITELRFAIVEGIVSDTLSNQIRFSTTSKASDGLGKLFADNVGVNEVIVFSGSLHLVGTTGGGFDMRIPLQTPFLYDPLAGNLLLDVRNFSTLSTLGGRRTLRAEDTFGDSVSIAISQDVNSPSGFLSTLGLVTVFEVTPIPEPSTILLLSFGLTGLSIVFLRRKRLPQFRAIPEKARSSE